MILDLDFNPAVQGDLDAAFEWHEQRRPGLGVKFIAAVDATIRFIRLNPRINPILWREIRRASTDEFPYGVFYRVDPGMLTVVAVDHARRDPGRWRSRA